MFAGPGVLVSVGYMDPGNWGTDLAAGASYRYELLWVILVSSLIAMFLQNLCARLGIVGKIDLAQACLDHYSKRASTVLWVFAQIAIIACDLAEVIGSAVALQLLLHIPLIIGVFVTAFDVLVLLGLMRFGFRKLEAVVASLVMMISVCFLLEIIYSRPSLTGLASGLLLPKMPIGSVALAVGILGATVMPHNLYLHSAAVQTRDISDVNHALRMNKWDTYCALGAAFFVNAAILVVAAATFYKSGHHNVDNFAQAQTMLRPLLGSFAATVFAIGLLASGQSSTITGTLAGQVVMKGLLKIEWKPWLTRLVTRSMSIIPAAIVVAIWGSQKTVALLIISQVVLSIQLPFAVFPLLKFTNSESIMGVHKNSKSIRLVGWFVAWAIVGLNMVLIYQQFGFYGVVPATGFGLWFTYFLQTNRSDLTELSQAA